MNVLYGLFFDEIGHISPKGTLTNRFRGFPDLPVSAWGSPD